MTKLPEAKLYIDGKLRRAAGDRTFEVVGPWTGEITTLAADASAEDMNEAIAAARRAFDTTDWASNRDLRLQCVTRLRDLLYANRERLVDIARLEVGAAMGAIFSVQVDGALSGLDALIELFPTVTWEEDRGTAEAYGVRSQRLVVHEPVGVAAAITPWNVPLYINVAKVISGLLAGCTVILKPAPDTPSAAAILGELAHEAGFPPGVFNVVTGADPAMLGEMLTLDPRVDLITFTGSTAVGKRIMEKGASTLKRLFLELGGKSANIILDDAPNFAQTVASSIVCFHAGQGCAIATRLLVPRSRYAEAIAALEQAYQSFSDHWGDPEAPSQVMGPVISKKQMDRVLGYIELGQKEGARLLAGGHARPDKGGGFFVEPTCFVDVSNDMRIAQEEIFGPVLVVIPFEDDDDAIRIANQSEYGLAGHVASGDKARALRIARAVRTGSVGVNGAMAVGPDLPFGGFKSSGVGREWGREGIEEYLESKVIAVPA
ncbi:MAG TPA: aldehyde dehydrogenase family protein [Phenylobacterium sp.]|uniref:aldehyde dehydrogenase family protein n=1 Tax=Phenylobacterium sp. TaxID=1871053 RepID=UPI002B488B7F|nr:aldehyde dehydrogenase family protein [Phenylobacterium sp.]HKR90271.1 aldehyde dehydrogenase family protein [Phenylobacterium sp.]